MSRIRTTVVVGIVSILIALFFAGLGDSPHFTSAVHAVWKLITDTVRLHNLTSDYYGFYFFEVVYSLRLLACAIMGAYLLGLLLFLVLHSVPQTARRFVSTIMDFLEIIPETMYIICLALLVIILIQQYQISIPAFPTLAPRWGDTFIPALALAVPSALYFARNMELAFEDEAGADYMLTARSKGLSLHRMFIRHAMPNVIAQSWSSIGVIASIVISSSLFTEFFFGYQGILFRFSQFAGWNMQSGFLIVQKQRYIAEYNIGSIALTCVFLILLWILVDSGSNSLRYRMFPKQVDRQPGMYAAKIKLPWVVGGSILLVIIVMLGTFPHLLTSHSPNQQFHPLSGLYPSKEFPFGTDDFGRDVLPRILYGTDPTLLLIGGISLLVLIMSMLLAVCSVSISTGWLKNAVHIIARSLSPLPALMVLFLAMLQRDMHSPHQELQYITWIVLLEVGRGAFAFQSKISEWLSFRFIEGAESVGSSRLRTIFTQLRPWLWRYIVEFTFNEVIRILALIIELAAFHIYPKETVGAMPYMFVGHPPGILSAQLNWLSVIGPIMNQYSYISYPSTLYGPLVGIMALTLGSAMIVKGLRGKKVI